MTKVKIPARAGMSRVAVSYDSVPHGETLEIPYIDVTVDPGWIELLSKRIYEHMQKHQSRPRALTYSPESWLMILVSVLHAIPSERGMSLYLQKDSDLTFDGVEILPCYRGVILRGNEVVPHLIAYGITKL